MVTSTTSSPTLARLCTHSFLGHANNTLSSQGLSLSIGGATACFVGTDCSFGSANYLMPFVGIPSGPISTVHASCIAGMSTGMGFMAVQAVQNRVVPAGKNWID